MNTDVYCCESPALPKGVNTYHSLFGGYVASCDNCDYVCVYWECACELAHECKAVN